MNQPVPRWRSPLSPRRTAALLAFSAFVVAAIIRQLGAIQWEAIQWHPGWIAGAIACLFGVGVCQAASMGLLLRAYGHRLRWREIPAMTWLPAIGKYIPGKVAAVIGVVWLAGRFGVPRRTALLCAVLMDGLAVITGLIVAAPLLAWNPILHGHGPWTLPLAAAVVIAGATALHPRLFGLIADWMLIRLRREPIGARPSTAAMIGPIAAAIAQWLLAGLALWMMTRSIAMIDPRRLGLTISLAAAAATIGYLALFAPGGLGVREGVLLVILSGWIGPPAAIVAVAMRLTQTIVEATLATIGLLALRASRQSPPADRLGGDGG